MMMMMKTIQSSLSSKCRWTKLWNFARVSRICNNFSYVICGANTSTAICIHWQKLKKNTQKNEMKWNVHKPEITVQHRTYRTQQNEKVRGIALRTEECRSFFHKASKLIMRLWKALYSPLPKTNPIPSMPPTIMKITKITIQNIIINILMVMMCIMCMIIIMVVMKKRTSQGTRRMKTQRNHGIVKRAISIDDRWNAKYNCGKYSAIIADTTYISRLYSK